LYKKKEQVGISGANKINKYLSYNIRGCLLDRENLQILAEEERPGR
jgi:hypothetical protein